MTSPAPAQVCPIAPVLQRLGGGWGLQILCAASHGISRFDHFKEALGVAPNVLSQRLAGLVGEGLLAKQRYSERPPRDDYLLTETGRSVIPVLSAMTAWDETHFPGDHQTSSHPPAKET